MRGDRLAIARKAAGLTQSQLAVSLGKRYDRTMIGHVEHGRSALRLDGATRAAQLLNVSLDWLTGLSDERAPNRGTTAGAALPAEEEATATAALLAAQKEGSPGIRAVPLIAGAAAAAGAGAHADAEHVLGYVPFRQDWLAQRSLNPDQCSVIEVVGDSMEPTLENGAFILVDHRRRQRRSDRIFCIRTEDGPVVKRVVRIAGAWRLFSDNEAYRPLPWPAEGTVIGQVMWTGRTL